ncbi:MAG: hypothetical protein GY862_20125 [Gammaproteobacteria bacterium]|nr:hypothetical protein [Gammaproteobacteria bacterium]
MNLIVSDASTLIVLERLDSLPLLCVLFDRILLPQTVADELLAGDPKTDGRLQQAECYETVAVNASDRLSEFSQWLDKGEAEAIELALIRRLPLIIDERKGRKIARQRKLSIIGLAGLLLLAAKRRLITPEAALCLLDQAVLSGFRLSNGLYRQVKETLARI